MPRDTSALLIRKWAVEAGAIVETPEAAGLDRSEGFPAAYSEDMARTLAVWNQQVREVTAALVEIAERGVLEWSGGQRFEHPAWTTGSNGGLYRSGALVGRFGSVAGPGERLERVLLATLRGIGAYQHDGAPGDHRNGHGRGGPAPAMITSGP